MTNHQNLFGEALSEIAGGPRLNGHSHLTKELMQRLAEKGLTLAMCAGPQMMNRSLGTLQGHARKYKIAFPDYVPMKLRRKVKFVLMGDFYEVIGDDAPDVAAHLGITLTKRNGTPMCGIPVHAIEDYRAKLEPTFAIKLTKAKTSKRYQVAVNG